MGLQPDASSSFVTFCLQHKWPLLLSTLVLWCVFTRIQTGRQYTRDLHNYDPSQPRKVPMLPYWLPWIGHSFHYVLGMQEYFVASSKKHPGGVFALRIAGGTHNVIVSPSLAKEIFTRRGLPIEVETFVNFAMTAFFGDRGECKRLSQTPEGHAAIWGGAHKAIAGLMREPFLGSAVNRTSKAVGQQVRNLVSLDRGRTAQSPWERSAGVRILPAQDEKAGLVAEGNSHILMRNWVSAVVTPLMIGQAFMDNNPSFVEDIWKMNSKMEFMLAGIPRSLAPGLSAAYAARERLIAGLLEVHQAMFDVLDGRQPDPRYRDISDIPQFMWDRVKAMRIAGASLYCITTGNLSVTWAMNVNANQIVWWVLFYIYSNIDLLVKIRKEVEPFVKARESKTTGSAINDIPEFDIDVQGLFNDCPLLKGAAYETMRFEVGNAPFKTVTADFAITESPEDATIAGKSRPESYILNKGDYICTTNLVHQYSDDYFDAPQKFNPKRFWVEEDAKAGTEKQAKVAVEYGQMKIWGGGQFICKGRAFAEREILIFVAGVISCWEMKPADSKMINADGSWKYPGRKLGAGATSPVKDMPVRIWRREVS